MGDLDRILAAQDNRWKNDPVGWAHELGLLIRRGEIVTKDGTVVGHLTTMEDYDPARHGQWLYIDETAGREGPKGL
ncbi:hypothetical protein GCM10027280_20980 [Micromonospora polyrhachis]|uniref:Uncharacterized protein n=1 Tax=Micromonospora polyrhachis TaxID=1282883 RepID=A0A7W7SVH9_9ACTN|nr:hypothetical protein [Micromonospora polyrhachis]MBB4961689.1 hypothetical protein [Micromonospora polyrhachis]